MARDIFSNFRPKPKPALPRFERDDALEVMKRLRLLGKEMTELLAEIEVKPFDRMQLDKCRRLYAALKQKLKDAVSESSTISKQATRNEVEDAFFDQAVGDAICRLTAATNSNPFNSDWNSQIYDAREDIKKYLRLLEEIFPE